MHDSLSNEPVDSKTLHSMLRVDQAGEYGAVRIYQGQLTALGSRHPLAGTINSMLKQEEDHLQGFNALMKEHGVRPTLLQPIWHGAGFALGAVTALIGPRAAMACTVAVEEVIDDHYQKQRERLKDSHPDLEKTLAKYQEDELHHRQIGVDHDAESTPGYPIISAAIKIGCHLAIALSKRL